jgi:hypothetical protein
VVVERRVVADQPHYRVPAIRHWSARTSYPTIADDLKKMFDKPVLSGALLVADVSTSGLPVYQLLRRLQIPAQLRGVIAVGGHIELQGPEGVFHITKQFLIATTEIVLGQRRIEFARMPEPDVLIRELGSYTTRPAPSAGEVYAWRESEVDELISALSVALWAGERHDRMTPQVVLLEPGPHSTEADDIGPDGMTQQ